MATRNQVDVGLSGNNGTGSFVGNNSPSLTTPNVNVATATSINKMAITAPATSSTIAVADGKTFTVSNTLTATGTDSSSVAFGAGGTVLYKSTGSVIQSVSSANIAGSSTTSITFVDVTSASLAITPTLSSSTILVIFSWQAVIGTVAATNTFVSNQVVRTSTPISSTNNLILEMISSTLGVGATGQSSFYFLDSPATTSSTTYKLQQLTSVGTATASSLNVTITLMELSV